MNPLSKAFKAIHELGYLKLFYFGLYQLGLHSGHYHRMTPSRRDVDHGTPGLKPFAHFPELGPGQQDLLLSEADHIRRGQVRLFGGELVPLELDAGASSQHWTILEKRPTEGDIKFIWEPARFGWAITLARAYAFSGEPVYAQEFWQKTLHFLNTHPPNLGRQWQSAQEVAIRLMALMFCDRVLAAAPSSTPENRARLWAAIAEHAARIPPTLVYARAQNNNHLLSEAAGLYAAGIYLPSHPQANQWRQLGWRWLNWGFQHQITEFGNYNQHSVNYHRLMLQLALFSDHLRRESGDVDWPETTLARLVAGTRWLWALTDPKTGRTPNLGAHDSAYIFPLTTQPFWDFRPVVNAAAKAFLNLEVYPQPIFQEMGDWKDLSAPTSTDQKRPQAPDMLRVNAGDGCAFLRTAQFIDRPSHADQLHADLWWRGVNIALDPGSYMYNGPQPWDNALVSTQVHNTLTLDGKDQMTHAGRFLWLDWAQAEILAHALTKEGELAWVTAEHEGYQKKGARHQRILKAVEMGWEIIDSILPYGEPDQKDHSVRLTWLLPDWDWRFDAKFSLRLTGLDFSFLLNIEGVVQLNLIRAGKTVHGALLPEPIWGWRSEIYGVKEPALMLIASNVSKLPITLKSTFKFFP